MQFHEVNFDGLVGPTHNYAGLSLGNVASQSNAASRSNPRAAALQGLAKMKRMTELGLRQAVLPPQARPAVEVLRALGFGGTDAEVIARAAREAPRIFQACCSASSMWTANAATVSPSADSLDGRVHFTPANLSEKFHRAIEHPTTGRILRAIFRDERRFAHHAALPSTQHFGDEGAANHTRLAGSHGAPGVQLFVYGRRAFAEGPQPERYPARQTLEASEAIARLHRLDPAHTVFAQQHPAVIDQGVFHNDVIAVGNGNALLFHEDAFLDSDAVLAELRAKFGAGLGLIAVKRDELGVAEAVKSYLFNSQLLTLPEGGMALILPAECRESPAVSAVLERVLAEDNPIARIEYVEVRESMRNGGGPACLRLRVALSEDEIAASHAGVYLDDALHGRLVAWVERHYRDRLDEADLADPQLLDECRTALDELTGILGIGPVYPFQLG